MARFLFTMLVVNDLGLPTRLVPIARVLADRGHDVALFNPAPAPAREIADAGQPDRTPCLIKRPYRNVFDKVLTLTAQSEQ